MPRPGQNRHLPQSPTDDPPADVYPLPQPDDDPRFTLGLIIDVANVLIAHGYPRPVTGSDYVELQQALFRFIYVGRS